MNRIDRMGLSDCLVDNTCPLLAAGDGGNSCDVWGGASGVGFMDDDFGWGLVDNPNAGCSVETGGDDTEPLSGPTPDCGDAVQLTGYPSSKLQQDELAVLFGEDSWSMIGQSTLPGALTTSSTGRITADDVGVEEAYMVATMANLAAAYQQTIEWTIQNNQYVGFNQGQNLVGDALGSPIGSSQCDHLYSAIAAISVAASLNAKFTQWRSATNRTQGSNDVRIAGTDFFVPAQKPVKRPKRRKIQ